MLPDFCSTLPDMTDLEGTGQWCGGGGRSDSPALCLRHFVTAKDGHPQRCEYNQARGRCVLGTLFRCCDHFCSTLVGKQEANAGNPGRGPYCNTPDRRSSKAACESTYWTGGDGASRYNCVYDAANVKCRLALGTSFEAAQGEDGPSDACTCP